MPAASACSPWPRSANFIHDCFQVFGAGTAAGRKDTRPFLDPFSCVFGKGFRPAGVFFPPLHQLGGAGIRFGHEWFPTVGLHEADHIGHLFEVDQTAIGADDIRSFSFQPLGRRLRTYPHHGTIPQRSGVESQGDDDREGSMGFGRPERDHRLLQVVHRNDVENLNSALRQNLRLLGVGCQSLLPAQVPQGF